MTTVMSVPASQMRSAGPRLGREAMRTRFPPRPVAVTWPTEPCDRQTTIRLATADPLVISNPVVQAKRVRGLRHLLDWLADQPGDTWQQRWTNSDAEALGARWRQAPITWLAARVSGSKSHRRRSGLQSDLGWDHVCVIVSLVYKVARKLLSVPGVLLRRDTAKDAELLVSMRMRCCAVRLPAGSATSPRTGSGWPYSPP
jgi:hypothetical protein